MSFTDTFSSAVHRIRNGFDSEYTAQYQEEKANCTKIEMAAVAGIVGSVALGILGFSFTATGGIAAIIGVPLLLASAPLGYASYNCYEITKNLLDIFNNPAKYRILGLGEFDKNKIRNKLEEGTFLCNWAIQLLTANLDATRRRDSHRP
jgi:hypothetical protein